MEIIKTFRKERNITQDQISERLGVEMLTYGARERRGSLDEHITETIKMAKALEVSPMDLLAAAGYEWQQAKPITDYTTEELLAEIDRRK